MSGWQPIGPDHFLNQPGPHAAELNQYLAAKAAPGPIPDEGMHLPTLEAVRQLVQARVDRLEEQTERVGALTTHTDGYLLAMNRVLDMLTLLAGGRP